MISMLQYPISCTPVPRRAIVEYKKLIVDFIWSSKRSKIAYNSLIQDIKQGGLRLADLDTRICTTHISLIRKAWLNPDSVWALTLKEALKQQDIHTILACKANWANVLSPHYTLFNEIFRSWEGAHNFDPDTEEMVQREIVWNNQSILIGKKPVHWQTWDHAGIKTIADLLHDQEARFLSHDEISQKYGVPCSFLNILQIRMAIPVKWKRLLTNPASQNLTAGIYIRQAPGDYLKITSSSSKTIYGALIRSYKPSTSAQQKWVMTYPTLDPTQGGSWELLYQVPYRAIRDTKYQAFQYKVLQRIVPCNKYLANIRIKKEDTCTFCDEIDSIQHFLLDCENTRLFWSRICTWMEQNTGLLIDISQQEYMLGVHPTSPGSRKINFIALFAKFFIHRQKLFHQGDFPLPLFLRELRTKLQIEKQISFLEGKPEKFRCWEQTLSALG